MDIFKDGFQQLARYELVLGRIMRRLKEPYY